MGGCVARTVWNRSAYKQSFGPENPKGSDILKDLGVHGKDIPDLN
jgi:hypothetical protein